MTSRSAPSQPLPMLRLVVLGLLLLAPVVALGLSPWRADSSLWYFGMLPAVMGLLAGPKAGYSAAGSTPLLMGAALALRHDPAAGGIFMAAIGVLVGLAAPTLRLLLGSWWGPLPTSRCGGSIRPMPGGSFSPYS